MLTQPKQLKTFDDLCQSLLFQLSLSERPRTHKVAIAPINHLLKTFSGVKVKDVNSRDFWLKHVPRCRLENPARNLNHDHKLFVQLLNYGFELGVRDEKCPNIRKPSTSEPIGRELSTSEIERLLAASYGEIRLQIVIALKTGMRKGEILSLSKTSIDFARKLILLRPSQTKIKRRRVIPISDELCYLLHKAFEKHGKQFLFPQKRGTKPVVCNKFLWQRTKRLAGVDCRFHDLRHTSATQRLRAGISPYFVSKVLGMSIDTLDEIYQHLGSEDLRRAATILG
jgi:integrase